MHAVTNTSLLPYLILREQVDLLPHLHERLIVPRTVLISSSTPVSS